MFHYDPIAKHEPSNRRNHPGQVKEVPYLIEMFGCKLVDNCVGCTHTAQKGPTLGRSSKKIELYRGLMRMQRPPSLHQASKLPICVDRSGSRSKSTHRFLEIRGGGEAMSCPSEKGTIYQKDLWRRSTPTWSVQLGCIAETTTPSKPRQEKKGFMRAP